MNWSNDRVIAMNNLRPFYQLLGLANRAGKCITGEEAIINALRKQKLYLVIVAKDASPNTKKRYSDKCSFYNVPCLELGTVVELSHAIGKFNRVAIGISDQGFAKGLWSKIEKKE